MVVCALCIYTAVIHNTQNTIHSPYIYSLFIYVCMYIIVIRMLIVSSHKAAQCGAASFLTKGRTFDNDWLRIEKQHKTNQKKNGREKIGVFFNTTPTCDVFFCCLSFTAICCYFNVSILWRHYCSTHFGALCSRASSLEWLKTHILANGSGLRNGRKNTISNQRMRDKWNAENNALHT